MDEDIKFYIEKNRLAWERAAKKRFYKKIGLSLLVLYAAFLALFTEYGFFMSLALVLSLLVKYGLEPISIRRIRKYKNYNDELD